eukprot:scaffold2053_cov342-Prasinococcus_capsulatus_cf.AAC.5
MRILCPLCAGAQRGRQKPDREVADGLAGAGGCPSNPTGSLSWSCTAREVCTSAAALTSGDVCALPMSSGTALARRYCRGPAKRDGRRGCRRLSQPEGPAVEDMTGGPSGGIMCYEGMAPSGDGNNNAKACAPWSTPSEEPQAIGLTGSSWDTPPLEVVLRRRSHARQLYTDSAYRMPLYTS